VQNIIINNFEQKLHNYLIKRSKNQYNNSECNVETVVQPFIEKIRKKITSDQSLKYNFWVVFVYLEDLSDYDIILQYKQNAEKILFENRHEYVKALNSCSLNFGWNLVILRNKKSIYGYPKILNWFIKQNIPVKITPLNEYRNYTI
jgi:hypothetical protein